MQYLQDYEIRQLIQSLCMMNNRFMNLMLEDNIEAAQVLLRVTLKNDKIKVIKVKIQSFIQNLYGHSAQLDILAEDENGNYFNVEVQRSDEGAQAKRARYYSSILDTHFLQSGKDYVELPDSYVIFITENDVLNKGLPLYHVQRTIDEDGTKFSDGSHIIYVNSSIQDDTALGRLMQDMYCSNPAQLNYKEFAPRMEQLKYSKERELEMTDIMDFYIEKYGKQYGEQYGKALAEKKIQEAEQKAQKAVQEAVQEATENSAKETARKENIMFATNLLNSGMSAEFIAQNTKLSLDEVRELAAKLSA